MKKGFIKKLFKNKKGSELASKITVAAFAVAAGAAVITYTSNVIIEAKNKPISGILENGDSSQTSGFISEEEGTEGLLYSYNGAGYTVSGYNGTSTRIKVPSTHEGLPVTTIGTEGIAWNDDIETVEVGQNVKIIENDGFYGLHNVSSIILPNTVTSFGFTAFGECDNMSSFTIPESVTTIGELCFECNISSIRIPKNVTFIGEQAFHSCKNLSSIEVADENQVFSSDGGVLFNKNKTEMLCLPNKLTNFSIPNSVTTIKYRTSGGNFTNETIFIPLSVTTIESGAFYYCRNLVIHCEATSKPNGWASNWCEMVKNVIWGA